MHITEGQYGDRLRDCGSPYEGEIEYIVMDEQDTPTTHTQRHGHKDTQTYDTEWGKGGKRGVRESI